MTIDFGSKQLCNGSREVTEERFSVNQQYGIQSQPGLRWQNVVNYSRGNSVVSISFSSTELFTSLGAAEYAVANRGKEVRAIGKADLKVKFSDNTGQRVFKNAVCVSCNGSRTGGTAYFTYTFTAERAE